jgi:hypothetical protein
VDNKDAYCSILARNIFAAVVYGGHYLWMFCRSWNTQARGSGLGITTAPSSLMLGVNPVLLVSYQLSEKDGSDLCSKTSALPWLLVEESRSCLGLVAFLGVL